MWSALICKCKQYRFCWPRPLFCNKRIHDLLNLDPDTLPHLISNKLHNLLIFEFMHVWSYNTLCWVQSFFLFLSLFIYLFLYAYMVQQQCSHLILVFLVHLASFCYLGLFHVFSLWETVIIEFKNLLRRIHGTQ